MSAVITEQELTAACRETLRLWPRARAAVLFGSRARGTQRPDSDWDVAFVLEGDDPRHPDLARSLFPHPGMRMPADLHRVDAWALSEEDLRRNARALGTLPYVVCRDGKVLAGEWNRPDPVEPEGDAAMDPEDWAGRMGLVPELVFHALTSISRMATAGSWANSGAACRNLLRNAADAAELLVKAAMERRGVPADHGHDIAELAGVFAARRADEGALAERMAALNGSSRPHHVAMDQFPPPTVAEAEAALARIAGTLDLLASEIEMRKDAMAGQITDLARDAADGSEAWPDLVTTPVAPKRDEDHPARTVAEAALSGRPALNSAIASFQGRMRRTAGAGS